MCRMTEDQARAYLEALRWPDGPICPHCGGVRAMALSGAKCRPGLRKCSDCRKQFTVTVGTIMERSHIALRHWVYAFARMCASKKGVSAKQLEREIGITYKAAWFMCHRIRHAFKPGETGPDLKGRVQVDETHVGPRKPRYRMGKAAAVRGTLKQPVLALVETGGQGGIVRTLVIPDISGRTLKQAIIDNVDPGATIVTDEWTGYSGIGKHFAGGHEHVKHRYREYVTADGTTTNTVESWFALLKRGLIGTFHHVGRWHLHRYCDEFAFRWNHRTMCDVDRTATALRQIGGKRLTYRSPAA